MNLIVDTRAHLCDPAFDSDLEQVLLRAQTSGVSVVVAVSETLAEAEKNLILGQKFSMIRPAAGLYPTHLDVDPATLMTDFIRRNREQLRAIGEVGLDYRKVKGEADRRFL